MAVRRARLTDACVALSCALGSGCATAPTLGLRPMEVPPAPRVHAFVTARLDADLPGLMQALAEHGRDGYRSLRLGETQVEGWLGPEAIVRGRTMFVGMVPGLNDRRWFAWHRWRGSVLVGWCARGVRVLEAGGAEGFVRRTLLIDRLLVVGGRGENRWAAWLEGVMLSSAGWRFAPWVPHAQAVEGPRRLHPDVELWDCDLARPPTISVRPPGG